MMGGWSNALFDGVLALTALWGAMRLYRLRAAPGMMFGAAALLAVFAAALFGTLRYGGIEAVTRVNDALSLISAIVSPSWVIGAVLLSFRGGQDMSRAIIIWAVPAGVAALSFLPQTAMLGEAYAQVVGLGMLCVLVGAGVIAAIRGRTFAGAALAISAAGYALAALAMLGVFGGTETAELDIFHIGIAIWAGSFAWGLPETRRSASSQ
jgi:hypothetical protein